MPQGQGRPYGADPSQGQGYGNPQGYGDPRMNQGPDLRSPTMPRYAEKGPPGQSSVRRVPLRVEKVPDKTMQSRMIYTNMYVMLL